MLLFRDWNDRGWLFSKSLGLVTGGYVLWVCNTLHLLKFRTWPCFAALLIPAAAGAVVYTFRKKKGNISFSFPAARVLAEETAFFLLLALWVYIIGFYPDAYGTEKFMDYAFINSILRSDYMPPADPWFAPETIKYYYGGQFLTAFLIRLSRISPGEGYTMMHALITTFSFMLPFSLASQMLRDRFPVDSANASEESVSDIGRRSGRHFRLKEFAENTGGALAGLAVAFCRSFHYCIYAVLLPLWHKIRGTVFEYRYFLPDPTRFIGYHPDAPDKVITEFPAYSTILGDLHAHYINLILTVLAVAIAYAWARRKIAEKKTAGAQGKMNVLSGFPGAIFAPEILLIGALTGLFRWTNFWDFPIYFVVCCTVIFFVNLRVHDRDGKSFLLITLCQGIVIFLIGLAVSLPFTRTFDQIASEILPTHSHTPLWQLLILWGLPVTVSVCYIASLVLDAYRSGREARSAENSGDVVDNVEKRRPGKAIARFFCGILSFFRHLPLPDLLAGIFAACAMGLIWLPEVIYINDLYEGEFYRANTVFKLTYQAFILFGIVMGYVLVRALALQKQDIRRCGKKSCIASSALPVIGILLLLFTGGYIINGVETWYGRSGNILNPKDRISSDASIFLEHTFPSDRDAVHWLMANAEGQPVILEADGNSFSDCGRVSVATGLPTVVNWYEHEMLWRNWFGEDNRLGEISAIYTGEDPEIVRDLIGKYGIRYVYIGQLERSLYPDLNEQLLTELGTVVYDDGDMTRILEFPEEF